MARVWWRTFTLAAQLSPKLFNLKTPKVHTHTHTHTCRQTFAICSPLRPPSVWWGWCCEFLAAYSSKGLESAKTRSTIWLVCGRCVVFSFTVQESNHICVWNLRGIRGIRLVFGYIYDVLGGRSTESLWRRAQVNLKSPHTRFVITLYILLWWSTVCIKWDPKGMGCERYWLKFWMK